MKYPNLTEVVKHHPYHICTFAGFADVTVELMEAVVYGDEELTATELFKISRYCGIPLSVLSCRKLIRMDRKNRKHMQMWEELDKKLRIIAYRQKQGNQDADLYMKYKRCDLINYYLAILDDRATYGWYFGVRETLDHFLSFSREEPKPRGLIAS